MHKYRLLIIVAIINFSEIPPRLPLKIHFVLWVWTDGQEPGTQVGLTFFYEAVAACGVSAWFREEWYFLSLFRVNVTDPSTSTKYVIHFQDIKKKSDFFL